MHNICAATSLHRVGDYAKARMFGCHQIQLLYCPAFHVGCFRIIVGIRWHDFITNYKVTRHPAVPPLTEILSKGRLALFDHIARLEEDVPAHQILHYTSTPVCHLVVVALTSPGSVSGVGRLR